MPIDGIAREACEAFGLLVIGARVVFGPFPRWRESGKGPLVASGCAASIERDTVIPLLAVFTYISLRGAGAAHGHDVMPLNANAARSFART